MSIYLDCLAAILTATVLHAAVRHSLRWWTLKRTACCPRWAYGDGTHDLNCPHGIELAEESLRDEQTFVDGWRASERCRRLPHSIDDEHILHHYSHDGAGVREHHPSFTCPEVRS